MNRKLKILQMVRLLLRELRRASHGSGPLKAITMMVVAVMMKLTVGPAMILCLAVVVMIQLMVVTARILSMAALGMTR